MSKNNKPHRANLLIRVEVNDVLNSGESSGEPVHSDILKEYGLKPAMVIIIEGFDMDNCLQKLSQKIKELGA